MSIYLPCSLVFTIPPLDNLMLSGEDLLLENLCSATLVDPRNLENLCGVDVGICSSAHDGYAADHAFVNLEFARDANAFRAR